jgi:deoxyribodipyrimidine photo-lyase
MSQIIIVWFRQDLRLSDHPALSAAANGDRLVIPCYVRNTQSQRNWLPGAASRWWLHHSLQELESDIKKGGGRLVLRTGDPVEVLTELATTTGASAVYWSRSVEPLDRKDEKSLKARLEEFGIGSEGFEGNLLFDPGDIRSQTGTPFKVFTPFWKNCLTHKQKMRVPSDTVPVRFVAKGPSSETLAQWQLLPTKPNWAAGFSQHWQPGERGGQAALREFAKRAQGYDAGRNFPAQDDTSRLSPYLHFGNISVAQAYAATTGKTRSSSGALSFQRELGWREFSAHLLFHFPQLPEKSFRPEFEKFPWRKDSKALRRWQQGKTGFPIVDAGMRQLWHTGWMHNRVRMVAASVLVKHLLVDWRDGQDWFWDTLVDADLPNNAAGWQWVAGCGADAAPYFRVFNPVLQGQKFDPDAVYVRRWVPEIATLPDKYIHAPWTAPEEVLSEADIRLGIDYPHPIVQPEVGRRRALDALAELKSLL